MNWKQQPWFIEVARFREFFRLGAIWLGAATIDRVWFALDRSVPAWDQADYLTGAMNYWQAFQTAQWFSGTWWTSFWQLSSKIPPLVYITTTPFLSLFGRSPDSSTLVNLLYSAILLGSVYAIGTCLFARSVGLWAAGLCVLMPGLYQVRLDYLMDYPLAAIVGLCFALLTLWRAESGVWAVGSEPDLSLGTSKRSWGWALGMGGAIGLAMLVKQPALFFLLVPLGWAGIEAAIATVRSRAWQRFAQWVSAIAIAGLVMLPWYRTNWLLILTAGKRATVDSAVAEGDPSLLSLGAWTYYASVLPQLISWPLLLVGFLGLLLFWRRSRVSSHWRDETDYAAKSTHYRHQIFRASGRSLRWLLGFCVGGYLLASLNVNKDDRYIVPLLPMIAVGLAYGMTLLPKGWRSLRWGAVGLSGVWLLANFLTGLPGLPGSLRAESLPKLLDHPAYQGVPYPHADVVSEVLRSAPYVRSTIGVLPSTPEINQHNINYFGNVQNFQVYGRQIGTRSQQVSQDARSLSWFLTKTDNQGSIRQPAAQTALGQLVEQSPEFRLQKVWTLPDRSVLKLFQRQTPAIEVTPLPIQPESTNPNSTPFLKLDRLTLPRQAPPGQPVAVTYEWSGPWEELRSGLMLLTWRLQSDSKAGDPKLDNSKKDLNTRWFHDHAIALGTLRSGQANFVQAVTPTTPFRVVEHLSMLPPANLPTGTYELDAVYVNRQTGASRSLATPAVRLQINPTAIANAAPELDWVTQLRSLATQIPQGLQALNNLSSEVTRISQYDPMQDGLNQMQQTMEYRWRQEPTNPEFGYGVAVAAVLKRRVDAAIAALEQLVKLDAQNPYTYGYLAFVNLYDLRPGAAQAALQTALQLNPNLPELHALNGIAAVMQGNLMQGWRSMQAYQTQIDRAKNPTKS